MAETRRNRWMLWLLVVVLVLVGLPVGTIAFVRWRGEREWERYKAEAYARGEKLELADFVTEPLPEEEDFFALPIFRAAAAAGENDPARRPFRLIERRKASMLKIVEGVETDLEEVRKAAVADGLVSKEDGASLDGTGLVLAALGKYETALASIAEGAQRRGATIEFDLNNLGEATFPELGISIAACELFTLRAAARISKGDGKQAVADLETAMHICRHLAASRLMIFQLSGARKRKRVADQVSRGLAQSLWSELELARLQRVLGNTGLQDYVYMLRCERAAQNAVYELLRRNEPNFQWVVEMGSGNDAQRLLGFTPLRPAIIRDNQVLTNLMIDELISRIDLAAGRWRVEAKRLHDPERIEGRLGKAYFQLAARSFPVLEQHAIIDYTLVQLVHTAVALERWRLKEGKYPEELVALVPEFLEMAPVDVMTGDPLRYRREEGGRYVLYSVGLNRVDDGGARGPEGDRAHPVKHLDWVYEGGR